MDRYKRETVTSPQSPSQTKTMLAGQMTLWNILPTLRQPHLAMLLVIQNASPSGRCQQLCQKGASSLNLTRSNQIFLYLPNPRTTIAMGEAFRTSPKHRRKIPVSRAKGKVQPRRHHHHHPTSTLSW